MESKRSEELTCLTVLKLGYRALIVLSYLAYKNLQDFKIGPDISLHAALCLHKNKQKHKTKTNKKTHTKKKKKTETKTKNKTFH